MNIKQVPAHPTNYSRTETQKKGFVLHWIVGELSSADVRFTLPNQKVSAHYGIGSDGQVHQYVQDRKIAWHAGNGQANRDYIGIEHAGGQLINGSRKTPTKACHDSSIELIAQKCRELGIKELVYQHNIFRHRDIVATQCSGTLDVGYIIKSVNAKLKEPEKPTSQNEIAMQALRNDYIGNFKEDHVNRINSGQWASSYTDFVKSDAKRKEAEQKLSQALERENALRKIIDQLGTVKGLTIRPGETHGEFGARIMKLL